MQSARSQFNAHLKSLVFLFCSIKVLLNALAAPHFGFQRDELLHLALGGHLGWGYKEVPPLVGLLAYLSSHLFGASVVAARIFPTLAAGLIVWFTGLLVIEFGGRRFAITLACLSLILSPAFAASDYLFQPVVFDQLWWIVSAWLTVKFVNTRQVGYLYWLGAVVGIGMLTKYSMAFFAFALLLGLLLTPQRQLLKAKPLLITLLITTLIFLPNIIWQYHHHWPFVTHMHKLKEQQLDYVTPGSFIGQQFTVNALLVILWLAGFVALLINRHFKTYRFLAFAYVLVFLFLLAMHGKSYYLFGAYPMLFAAGAYAFERLISKRFVVWRVVITVLLLLPGTLLLPTVLPIISLNQTLKMFGFVQQHMPHLKFLTRWEDMKQHKTTMDYADMLGWEEMTQKVAHAYQSLPANEQARTTIIADNYGEAAAIHHYHTQYYLPDAVCLNSSFALWAPPQLHASNIIYVSDDSDISDLVPLSESNRKTGSIENPLAREYGTSIFLIMHIKPQLETLYHDHWQQEQSQ